MVTELKCIEGWSVKVYWAGARLADFVEKFAPPNRDGSVPDVKNKPQNLVRYVSLQTPDEEYYSDSICRARCTRRRFFVMK